MTDQNNLTRQHFDAVARDWNRMAYGASLETYPTGQVRQDIVIADLKHREPICEALDIGCGTGKMVNAMRGLGYCAYGMDISPAMVEIARTNYPELVFVCDDITTSKWKKKMDVITCMGVLEYQEDDAAFMQKVAETLNDKGVLYIETRNRLFNLHSANQYTAKENLPYLVEELGEVGKYSQMCGKEAMTATAINIRDSVQLPIIHNKKPASVTYPSGMLRRQYTPAELDYLCAAHGLKLNYVVYYHIHPFPPRYEQQNPEYFNMLSLAMQPLGYSEIGATMGSSFVAVITK